MFLATICKIDVRETNMLFCPVKLRSDTSEYYTKLSLLDTGAAICHMTYPLWLNMGLHEECWNRNPELCKLMGIASPNDMVFEKLPLVSVISILGDGSKIKAYEFRLDELELGRESLGFNHKINFENITVRVINRKDSDFIVGWNVLKYLEPTYKPSLYQSIYQLELTEDGRKLLEQDRQNKISNYMQSMFNYQQN